MRATIDLLHALDHVHELGVVHCDLKPDNIFFHQDRGGVTPKLLDFGVVRVLARGEANAKLGGTLRYASPEQVRGEAVGPRSDVYSMALVLYEMLAGHEPVSRRDGRATNRARAARTHARVRSQAFPTGLMRILLRALAKDPADRPRDAFAFARELKDIEAFLPGDSTLDANVIAARAKCDEVTRVPDDATQRDTTMTANVTNGDVLTRYASGDGEGGGGRCDGFLP